MNQFVRSRVFRFWLIALVLESARHLSLCAAETNLARRVDYLEPAALTATIYNRAEEPREVLFTFRRTATRSNSTVRVLREYARPDGTVTARERVVYETDRLISFESEEPLSGARGIALIQANPKDSSERIITFEHHVNNANKTGRETLRTETLANDMVGPFIESHWDTLMSGSTLRFRFLALSRAETVGFKLVKTAETTCRGKPAVVLKLEPASWIIAQLIEPLLFTVEKEPPHRVFQYQGRTTPKIQKGNKWEDLDALTVFDWK